MYIIILTIIAFLFFVPIPINISFGYFNKKKYLKINGKNLLIKRSPRRQGLEKEFDIDKIKFNTHDYIRLHNKIKEITYIYRLEFNILVGNEDPFIATKIYNLFAISEVFIYLALKFIIPIKHYKVRTFPNMNKNVLEFNGKCIFFISIAKTIYIIYIYRKFLAEGRRENNV